MMLMQGLAKSTMYEQGFKDGVELLRILLNNFERYIMIFKILYNFSSSKIFYNVIY